MSGDKAHYEQPIVFYSEYMTETKRVLIQLHEEEEEIVKRNLGEMAVH